MGMSERIKEQRLKMNLTQEELANKLGLQKSAVAKYENGRVENIKRSVILDMSKILDCTPSYLMGWDDRFSEESSILAAKVAKSPELKELVSLYLSLDDTGKLKAMDNIKDLAKIYRD